MKLQVLHLWTLLKVTFPCVYMKLSNSSIVPSPPIGRVLVPKAAVAQLEDLKAHYESPSYSDGGKKYMNQHTANTSKLPLIFESSNSENRTRIEVPSDASVGRSVASPKKTPRPKSPKKSIYSSKSNDDKLSRFREIFKKNKGKDTPDISP